MALAAVIIAVLFVLVPMIGGGIEDQTTPGRTSQSLALLNLTAAYVEKPGPIANVAVYNNSDMDPATHAVPNANFSYTAASGAVWLTPGGAVSGSLWGNGTYYVEYSYGSWSSDITTGLQGGGDFFSDMQGYIALLAIALTAIIIIGYLIGMGKI